MVWDQSDYKWYSSTGNWKTLLDTLGPRRWSEADGS